MQVRPLASMPSPSLAASLPPHYGIRRGHLNGHQAVAGLWGGIVLVGADIDLIQRWLQIWL